MFTFSNIADESQHHVAFLSSMCDGCCDIVAQNERDFSFLRLESCDFLDNSDIEYETLDSCTMSTMNDVFIYVSSMDYLQSADYVQPTALVAQVPYDNGDDSTNWIIDTRSTHHMNGFAIEFINMTLKGYDDGPLVKELVYGRKTYGIGSCIVVVKDSVGMSHPICLEDVPYVPNLLHHHPGIFRIISACSQNECQCHFQSNSYV
jgi:hypothetical protein